MTTVSADQDAIRVANRYAAMIEKAATLTARTHACETAAQQYRRDARANHESAESHRAAARASHDAGLAHQHTAAARDAETEAAREILAARMYEQQAEVYQSQAHGITPAGTAAARTALDGRREATGHYGGTHQHAPQGVAATPAATRKDAMTSPPTSNRAALPDTARLTETGSDHWHGSDTVTPATGDGTVSLGLCRYPDTAAYVVVATQPASQPWQPDSGTNGIDPALSKKEATRFAAALDDLAAVAESDARPPAPTKTEKLAARVRQLLGTGGVTISGDNGEIEVSAADIRRLLDAAAPEPAVATRHKIDAKECAGDGMDTGAVWAELDTSGKSPVIAVTSTEGEAPEDYPEGYAPVRLSPAEARQLAAKIRRFAAAGTETGTATQPAPAAPAVPTVPAPAPRPEAVAVPAGPRRVVNPRGKTYEYDPDANTTAVIEPDGWRAVVPAGSSTGIAIRLLHARAEIKDGRGADATTTGTARAMLTGLTGDDLREVAEILDTALTGARTKTQIIDRLVNSAIDAPRKYRGLQKW